MDLLKKAKEHVETLKSLMWEAKNFHVSGRNGFLPLSQTEMDDEFGIGETAPEWDELECRDPEVNVSVVIPLRTAGSADSIHVVKNSIVPSDRQLYTPTSHNPLPVDSTSLSPKAEGSTNRRFLRLGPLPLIAQEHITRVGAILSMGVENLGSNYLSRRSVFLRGTDVDNADGRGGNYECFRCRLPFGCWRCRMSCPVCEETFCPSCYGSGVLSKCFFDSGCEDCATIVQQHSYFHKVSLPTMESGVTCILYKVQSSSDHCMRSMLSSGDNAQHSLDIWLGYDVDRAAITWRSLHLKNNCPIDKGSVLLGRILRIQDSGHDRLLSLFGRSSEENLTVEFESSEECQKWTEAIKLAWILYAPQQQKVERQQLSADDRLQDLERRKAEREERKQKHLAGGMGMRFTAEAMVKASTERVGAASTSIVNKQHNI